MSEKGICSRREADRLVDEGKVMVNGVCAVMGQKVSSADEIVVDGKKVSTKQVKPVLIAVNKPAGIVCTTARFEGEKNIVDMVKYPTRIYPIGRLDKESEGLILMTNLGDLANEISKASNSHEKEYVVTVNNQVTESFLDKMRRGMHLEELNAMATSSTTSAPSSAALRWSPASRPARTRRLRFAPPSSAPFSWLLWQSSRPSSALPLSR